MENKQTAVEWLIKRWKKLQSNGEKMTWNQIIQITELAMQLEKEQIIEANEDCSTNELGELLTGEQYYNETYGK